MSGPFVCLDSRRYPIIPVSGSNRKEVDRTARILTSVALSEVCGDTHFKSEKVHADPAGNSESASHRRYARAKRDERNDAVLDAGRDERLRSNLDAVTGLLPDVGGNRHLRQPVERHAGGNHWFELHRGNLGA